MRLPVSYFDRTQSGVLIARIMNDAEGIRNLVGTGLVQLVGSIFTALIAFGVLMYTNWRLTVVTSLILGAFGVGMATTIMVGQTLGAHDVPGARRVVGTGLGFFVVLSLLTKKMIHGKVELEMAKSDRPATAIAAWVTAAAIK